LQPRVIYTFGRDKEAVEINMDFHKRNVA
jgi:hypothetical protein